VIGDERWRGIDVQHAQREQLWRVIAHMRGVSLRQLGNDGQRHVSARQMSVARRHRHLPCQRRRQRSLWKAARMRRRIWHAQWRRFAR
jgi:hypothetical protein